MGVWYATREDVKQALDYAETARANSQIDEKLEAAASAVEKLTHRRFHPTVATRYFDWPAGQWSAPWRLWLDDNELVSVTALSSGGVDIPAGNYFLEPVNTGPPYSHIEINLATQSAFGGGATRQRDITVVGVFDWPADEAPAGALAEALDTSETGVDVTDSAVVGVGSLIRVDDERMIVTDKSMLTAGQTLQAALSAAVNDVAVSVTTGSAFHVGETILLDSERMLVVDIAGNTLTVKRAWDGSVLAAHTAPTIYAPRTLTVTRGALGTAAAAHSNAAAIVKHRPPGPVKALAVAETINALLQESSGYARAASSGDSRSTSSGGALRRPTPGVGLEDIRAEVYAGYGRKARQRAV